MRLERSSVFDAPPEWLAARMLDPAVMRFLGEPLVVIKPRDPPALPDRWRPGRYRVTMHLLGLLPLSWQDIVVTEVVEDLTAARWGFHDAGSGRMARRWDHHLILEGLSERRARYTDRVEVAAGWVTLPLWLFAQLLFAWRHHRWRRLIAGAQWEQTRN